MSSAMPKPTHAQVVSVAATLPALVLVVGQQVLPFSVKCLLAQTAIGGFAVALASTKSLAKRTTRLLGKSARTGAIALIPFLAFFPFSAAIRTKLLLRRRHGSEPLYSKVTGGYYIGGWPHEQGALPEEDAAVVDCTCELPRAHKNPYLCCLTWDTHSPSCESYDKGVEFALKQRRDLGRSVLVHCAHGHGRSAAMLSAILIAEGMADSIDEAEAMIKAKRPRVRLNANQREGLALWLSQRSKKA